MTIELNTRNREPSFKSAGLILKEMPVAVNDPLINAENSYLRKYRLGECSVIVTREFGEYHLSVAHPRRDPTWLEISTAWYHAIPDAANRTGALNPAAVR